MTSLEKNVQACFKVIIYLTSYRVMSSWLLLRPQVMGIWPPYSNGTEVKAADVCKDKGTLLLLLS